MSPLDRVARYIDDELTEPPIVVELRETDERRAALLWAEADLRRSRSAEELARDDLAARARHGQLEREDDALRIAAVVRDVDDDRLEHLRCRRQLIEREIEAVLAHLSRTDL